MKVKGATRTDVDGGGEMDRLSIFDKRLDKLNQYLHKANDFSGEINTEYGFRGNFKSGLITITKTLWKGYGEIISRQDIFCGDLDISLRFAEALTGGSAT